MGYPFFCHGAVVTDSRENMKRVKQLARAIVTAAAFSLPLFPLGATETAAPAPPADRQSAQRQMLERQALIQDSPGTGRFPAMKEEVATLPDHVVYRPAGLDRLGATKLGVYIFGNGACSNDGASARLHLLEIASHGYLAIAPGRVRNGPGATPGPALPPQAQAPRDGARPSLPPPATRAVDLVSALDWALKQNDDAASPYYQKLDPKAVAVSGYSCGGLQALEIAQDPRIGTLIIMNSGIFNPGTGGAIPGMNPEKSLLETVHSPTLYILGGETDIAYANGSDDFQRLNHVPAVLANLRNAGHGGTYWEPHGGKAATAVVAWLEWQLRGDQDAGTAFTGEKCGLCVDPDWKIERKKIP
jgi:hypothetical protein